MHGQHLGAGRRRELQRRSRRGEAREFLAGFAVEAQVEMGGRNIASTLGALDGIPPDRLTGREFGEYGPSSGAGHTNIGVSAS